METRSKEGSLLLGMLGSRVEEHLHSCQREPLGYSHSLWWVSLSPRSPLQEVGSVLKELEDAVSDVQRVDAKAQSALDLKKQNLQDETKKGKELVKTMEEVLHGDPR